MDKFTAADVLREVSCWRLHCRSLWCHQSGSLMLDCLPMCCNVVACSSACLSLQVSVFDTINSAGGYSRRVRRLGEFHPRLAKIKSPDGQDIDDPLYGNVGGAAEKARTHPACATHAALFGAPACGCRVQAALLPRRKLSGRPSGLSRRHARGWRHSWWTFRAPAGTAVAMAAGQACGRGLQMRSRASRMWTGWCRPCCRLGDVLRDASTGRLVTVCTSIGKHDPTHQHLKVPLTWSALFSGSCI